MEEKNRLITLYIENKVKELENMSMFVSKDNVQKVINNFLNRNEDIEIIKTKIDTIFNNSIRAYKENLEKMGYTYDESGSIGKRYRREDAMGTPYCITIDEETINNGTVTIRDRDTMEQTTIKVEDIEKYIEERIKF